MMVGHPHGVNLTAPVEVAQLIAAFRKKSQDEDQSAWDKMRRIQAETDQKESNVNQRAKQDSFNWLSDSLR